MFSKFVKRTFLFLSPVLILALSYFVFDPFHVLKSYPFYGSNYLKSFNRNRMSTDTFLRNNKKYNFKSFIFGSSRSSAFRTYDWAKHINDPTPYHFDSFNDNISGIRGKIEFIENQGNKLENVLLVFDKDTFNEQYEESNSIVHHKDYRWTKENFFSYHFTFFKAYFQKQYFVHYLDLKLFNTYRTSMDEFFKFKYYYKAPFNDFYFPDNEAQIKEKGEAYFKEPDFVNRKPNPNGLEQLIKIHHVVDLIAVKEMLKRNNTKFKVVFSPIFDQRILDPKDVKTLQNVFGKESFYNYSGKNQYTNDVHNYYEPSHYMPSIGKRIMEEIYK
jgi:hypothetical protein